MSLLSFICFTNSVFAQIRTVISKPPYGNDKVYREIIDTELYSALFNNDKESEKQKEYMSLLMDRSLDDDNTRKHAVCEYEKALSSVTLLKDFYSPSCSWYCGVERGDIIVNSSSFLSPFKNIKYDSEMANDHDTETAWVEGADGDGEGEYLSFVFTGKCPRITTVKIINGYAKNTETWLNNSRVKRLKMYYNDMPYAILELKDTMNLQTFDVGILGYHSDNSPNWTLKFEILQVYRGLKYKDTAITELYFDGIDVH